MINKILKDIDNEECYYVGTNGCLYQDLGKEELLAIKQEIERLHSIIKEARKYIEEHSEMTDLQINGIENILAFRGSCKKLLEILDKVKEK